MPSWRVTWKRARRCCDYLNATESIAGIARELQINEKSLRRMLGPKGNPTLKNFLNLLKVCCSAERLTLQVYPH